MAEPLQTQIKKLHTSIRGLEAQRRLLGDAVVDPALDVLRQKLAELELRQPVLQQRRLATVLFLDIVNSTLLSQGLEPEEVLDVLGGALKRLSVLIEAYGGRVTQFMGDGFVAVFGLASVQENDAHQAVHAGLAILKESNACAKDLESRFAIRGFNIRIGINTGRVIEGRLTKSESTVVGHTVTLAARMEQAAPPGTLLISQFTYQHIRGAFEVEALSTVAVKGFSRPVAMYRVQAARPRTFRTFTRGVEGINTRLIGREVELDQLKENFLHAIQFRETRLVTIVGDAGVGKSRLLYEFDRWIARATSPLVAFKARASPQTATVPFSLLRDLISYRLGIISSDPADLTRKRLVEALSTFFEDEPEMKAHFVGSLLGFDFSGSPYLLGVESDPKQLSERAQLYLVQYIAAVASKMTTILMLDDLHHADPPSVAFITRLVRECPHLPLMVVCLARPILNERFPGWNQREQEINIASPALQAFPRSFKIKLSPLTHLASQELLGEILHNVEPLPDALREKILDSADGNPFYLEEFIQALVDTRAIRKDLQGGMWKLDYERLEGWELPTTLTGLLEARLDRLNRSQRTLVQQASVIGRVFWRSSLQVLHGDKPITDTVLRSLSKRGFFYPQEISTFEGTEEYRFHHGLLRDVAYQTLLKSDRKAYHDAAAAWLIEATRRCGRVAEFAPVIAKHYEVAAKKILAADWYIQSGTQARNQGTPALARTFFDRALSFLPSRPYSMLAPGDLARHWQALAGRDEVLGILGETEARMADDASLVTLAETMGDDHLLAEACFRQGYFLGIRGQYAQEREVYNRGLEAARRVQDRHREVLILGLKVTCETRLGDLRAASQTSVEVLNFIEELADDEILARSLTNVSNSYTEQGDMARASQLLARALEINRRTGNVEGEVMGLSNLGYAYVLLGQPEEAIRVLQRCIHLAQSIGHRRCNAYGGLNLALAYLRYGDPNSALLQLEKCLPELEEMNDKFGYAIGQIYAALAKEQAGQINQAIAGFMQAANILVEIGTPDNTHDAEAGAARCMMELNNLEAAQEHIKSIWNYLQQESKAGMEFPLLAYETCADFFIASGQASLARKAIEAGYTELMARANRISLPEWRKTFLEGVPEHQRIQARWNQYNRMVQE